MRPAKYFHTGISLFLTVTLCGPAVAEIEEITVTAQKREENVQNVPISVTTFSDDFFTKSNVNTLRDMARYAPNLSLPQSSTVANQRIILRGVGSVGNSAIEPTVAVFIDGVYYPRPSSIVGSMTDLDRAEVLRGPQGTLFGRNASMGALNIVTKNPTNEHEGRIAFGYGDYDEKRISGYINSAISEKASARLSFQASDRDGYGENTYTDQGSRSTVGDWDDVTVRGKLLFTPNDNTDVLLTADFSRVSNEGAVTEFIGDTAPTIPTMPTTSLDGLQRILGDVPEAGDVYDHKLHQMHRDDADDEQWGLSSDITWAVGGHTIRSITAYRDWENDSLDQSVIRLPADLVPTDQFYDAETFSQELQILSPEGGNVEYVFGLYYYDEEYTLDTVSRLGNDFCGMVGVLEGINAEKFITQAALDNTPLSQTFLQDVQARALEIQTALQTLAQLSRDEQGRPRTTQSECVAGGTDMATTDFGQDVANYAAYGHLTYHLTPQWRLSAAARYTRSEKDGSFTSIVHNPVIAPQTVDRNGDGIPEPYLIDTNGDGVPDAPNQFGLDLRQDESHPSLSHDEEKVTWLANVSHFLNDDTMLFANFSTGFKSGGFNPEGFNSRVSAAGRTRKFDTETTKNYEFGIKSTLLEGKLIANATLYRTKINDFQERQFDGLNLIVHNSGDLTQQGVELDLQFQPREDFFATLGVSYLDSEFDSFPDATGLPGRIAQVSSNNDYQGFCQRVNGGIQQYNQVAPGLGLSPITPLNLQCVTGSDDLQPPTQSLKGERNHFSPKWQISLTSEYTCPLPDTAADWFIRGEYQFVDDQNVGADTNQDPDTMQSNYNLFNGGAGVRGQNGDWEVSLFVKNIFDEEYCQTKYAQPLVGSLGLADTMGTEGFRGAKRCSLGEPRTWSLVGSFLF